MMLSTISKYVVYDIIYISGRLHASDLLLFCPKVYHRTNEGCGAIVSLWAALYSSLKLKCLFKSIVTTKLNVLLDYPFPMLKTVMVVVSMIVSHPQAVPWCLGLSLSNNQSLCSWLVNQSEAEQGGYFRRSSGIHDNAAVCETLSSSTCSQVS